VAVEKHNVISPCLFSNTYSQHSKLFCDCQSRNKSCFPYVFPSSPVAFI